MAQNTESVRIDRSTDASLDVDVQTTFMPAHDGFRDGGLAVAGGHEILPVVRATWGLFAKKFATCDRHPLGHVSLASSYLDCYAPGSRLTADIVRTWEAGSRLVSMMRIELHALIAYLEAVGGQILWPDHAIAGTPEGELHPHLASGEYRHVQVKGMDPLCDSYSGFRDNLKRPTGLADVLKREGVRRVFLRGLAFDFCVGWTALDAVAEGFEAFIIDDATRSVDMPGTVEKMRRDLVAAGVKLLHSSQLRVA